MRTFCLVLFLSYTEVENKFAAKYDNIEIPVSLQILRKRDKKMSICWILLHSKVMYCK